MKKCVLTGGPSIGKSTLIRILAERGLPIVQEAARIVIVEERQKDSEAQQMRNYELFQERVLDKQLSLEAATTGEVVYCDRGIIDGHAYCQIKGIQTPPRIFELGKNRYDVVFLLDPIGVYEKDSERGPVQEDAAKIHLYIERAYREFGYDPVRVPLLPPEERADFVVDKAAQLFA
jgi:predicted ATPase